MSVRAEKGFTPEQRRRLAGFGKIVSVDLETIETVGGGSARCMLAEVFSPRSRGAVKGRGGEGRAHVRCGIPGAVSSRLWLLVAVKELVAHFVL